MEPLGQKEFYRQIARLKGIPQDSQDQKELKKALFKQEIWTLAKGTPLDRTQRSFSRISTPDPVNINVRNIARVVSAPVTERLGQVRDRILGRKLESRRALTVKEHGRKKDENTGKERGGRLTFATGNTVHNFPWVRSIDSGSWAQKMEYVENSAPPTPSTETPSPTAQQLTPLSQELFSNPTQQKEKNLIVPLSIAALLLLVILLFLLKRKS